MVWGDKDSRINLRIPKGTRKTLDLLAKATNPPRTVSEYVRDLLIAHAEKHKAK
jgi:predicted DNA-binding protein